MAHAEILLDLKSIYFLFDPIFAGSKFVRSGTPQPQTTMVPRLTVADVQQLRSNSAPLPKGVAPNISADAFKSPRACAQPICKSPDHHFSIECVAFNGSEMKLSASVSSDRKIISLGTGRPTADYYPWERLTIEAMEPTGIMHSTQKNLGAPLAQTVSKNDDEYNLALAMNYGNAAGSPHLLRFITEHVEIVHDPPYANWGTCITAGSTSAMEIVYRIFCNRGDNILMEEYTYPGTLEGAKALDLKIQGVQIDAEGASAEHLSHILSTWDISRGPKPRVFYTIPSGQNPTGATQPLERRQQIYDIAEEHDLIIVEDDPYYFLGLGSRAEESATLPSVPTYLSIDKSGRVVRLDSASKILAPGLRAGWMTASSPVVKKFLAYQEISTASCAGPSQLILWKLLDESWGHNGFFVWLNSLSLEYRTRRDALLDACEKHLPKDVCSWVEPTYGMFLWITLDWKKIRRLQDQTGQTNSQILIGDIEDRILSTAMKNGVQVTKGSLFTCNGASSNALHFRMTFAAAAKEDLEEGVMIFANAVRSEFSLDN